MQKRTRTIILIVCFVLFFAITPWLILYSLGYKIDFKNQCIVATGGIYARTEQPGIEVIVDSITDNKTNFFSNSVFVQNLLPKNHNILIKKDGYIDYQKTLPVQEKEVTKVENITLFKNNIAFNKIDLNWQEKNGVILQTIWPEDSSKIIVKTKLGYFIIESWQTAPKTSSLPFLASAKEISFNPQNSNEVFFIKNNILQHSSITTNVGISPLTPETILQKVLAYKIDNNNIIWLATDGNLNKSDILGKNTEVITASPLLTNKNNLYKIFTTPYGIMVLEKLPAQAGNNLLLLDSKTKIFVKFLDSVNDLKISPDNQNAFYITNNDIWLNHSNYSYNQDASQNNQIVLLNKFYENISGCYWLNNDYLILRANDKIKISEIDNRGNINIIDLPSQFLDADKNSTAITNPDIYYNPQDKKVYVLTDGNLLSSDKLLP